MKTSIFKSIPTRQTSSSKTAKGKQTTRVIFPQVHSKPDIHVEEVTVSKPESHLDKQAFISKKDFDAFRDEVRREFKGIRGQLRKKFKKLKKAFAQSKEQVEDIEADKAVNVDGGGLEQSGQHFIPDVQSSNNISDGTKGCTVLNSEKMNVEIDSQQLIPDELLQSINLDYLYSEKVVQHDCQRDEKLWPDSQNNIPDEFLPSLNVYNHKSIIIHPFANREVKTPIPKLRIRRPSKFKESPYTKKFDSTAGSSAGVIRIFPQKHSFLYHPIDGIKDRKIVKNFTNWISADLLKDTAKRKGKVDHYKRRKSEISKMYFGVEAVEDKNWFYTMGFADQTWTDSYIDVCFYYLRKKSKYGPHSSYKNEPNKSYKYNTVDCNFMNVIRSLNDVYSMDAQNLKDGAQEHHLMEYINEFRMHAAVPWHIVEDIFIPINIKKKHHWVLAVLSFSERCMFLYDSYESSGHYAAVLAEIEKIAKIISLCLQACDFYVKKEIDHQSHPRYKDKESSDMFDVLFQDDLPQQPSGSL
ncbi:hypothetical protein BC332_07072 [Capsicum chinense]|nr:hypothetical protein BC332_07072 [Capsicum chinense]